MLASLRNHTLTRFRSMSEPLRGLVGAIAVRDSCRWDAQSSCRLRRRRPASRSDWWLPCATIRDLFTVRGQRIGTGRKLALKWAAAAGERGWASATVEVLAHNPPREFYERLGACHLEDVEVVIGDNTYIEARYG